MTSNNFSSTSLTSSEKAQADEKQLVDRLQTMIELIDNVNQAVINIDSPNKSEKTVDVLIITEPDTQLTDEQKSGITNIIKDSVNGTVSVNLKEESRTPIVSSSAQSSEEMVDDMRDPDLNDEPQNPTNPNSTVTHDRSIPVPDENAPLGSPENPIAADMTDPDLK